MACASGFETLTVTILPCAGRGRRILCPQEKLGEEQPISIQACVSFAVAILETVPSAQKSAKRMSYRASYIRCEPANIRFGPRRPCVIDRHVILHQQAIEDHRRPLPFAVTVAGGVDTAE